MSDYGKNLSWFLLELASMDSDLLETGEVEVIGETESGLEGGCTVNIEDLCTEASKKLDDQQTTIDKLVEGLKSSISFIEEKHPSMDEPTGLWMSGLYDLINSVTEKSDEYI